MKPGDLHARSSPAAGVDAARRLLDAALAATRSAFWEARGDLLEAATLDFGAAEPFLSLTPPRGRRFVRWIDHVYPLDRPRVKEFLAADGAGQCAPADYRVVLATGELRWIRHWLLALPADDSAHPCRRGIITAIPEEKLLEWECLRVSERERNRLGQELHDDLCQVLAGMSYLLRVLGGKLAARAPDLRLEFDELNVQVVDAMHRARALAHGLFPAQLRYGTLRQALRDLAQQSKTRFGVNVTLDLPRTVPAHGPEQIVHIYRIVQESLGNSIDRGKATEVQVRLRSERQHVTITIQDNGAGFPANSSWAEGIGLHVMQCRARVVGGALSFGNAPELGAVVTLRYPASPGTERARAAVSSNGACAEARA